MMRPGLAHLKRGRSNFRMKCLIIWKNDLPVGITIIFHISQFKSTF